MEKPTSIHFYLQHLEFSRSLADVRESNLSKTHYENKHYDGFKNSIRLEVFATASGSIQWKEETLDDSQLFHFECKKTTRESTKT